MQEYSGSFADINVAKPLNSEDKNNLRNWLLMQYDVDPTEKSFQIIENMFFSELQRLDYTSEIMENCLHRWKLYSKKYGNDLSALKRLEFKDIFSTYPCRLYSHKWFEKEAKERDGESYNALMKMNKYVKASTGSVYYSWHPLPKLPKGFVNWEDFNFHSVQKLEESEIKLDQQLNQLASEVFDLKLKLEKAREAIEDKNYVIKTKESNIKILTSRIQELESENKSLLDGIELEGTNE